MDFNQVYYPAPYTLSKNKTKEKFICKYKNQWMLKSKAVVLANTMTVSLEERQGHNQENYKNWLARGQG